MNRDFKTNTIIYNGGDIILITSWESKGLSKEVIEFPTTSKYLSPELKYVDGKITIEFTGSCLTRDKIAYTHGTIVNICIVYEITKNNLISSSPTLENCLFGAVKLTKYSDIDKYKYSGYGIGFARKGKFSFGDRFGRNVIFLGVDMSSSGLVENKKNILILGEGIIKD